MTEEGRQQVLEAELAAAQENLQGAELLVDGGLPKLAPTRIYFAAWHAVKARLASEGLEACSHNGVRTLHDVHFVKTGRASSTDSALLARLQAYRESADYSVSFVADESLARAELADVQAFVERVSRSLSTN